jgi:hypothetical protein
MTALVTATDLKRSYEIKQGWFSPTAHLQAVGGVSFTLETGKTLAVVGESGCGKSTLARLVTLIEPPSAGTLMLDGVDAVNPPASAVKTLRRTVQIVFQNPYGSLNPRMRVGDIIGLGNAAVTTYNIIKWPILLLIVSFLFALLYWASPNAKQGFRWVTPGGLLALVLWLIASAGFAFYVANFSSYNKTYGSLAGLIVFLIWLWITNIAILLGAELNAELERGRAIATGHPVDEEPYVELRDTRNVDEKDLPPQNR